MQVSRCLARSDTGTCVMVEDPVNLVISDAMLNVSLGQDSASGDFVQVNEIIVSCKPLKLLSTIRGKVLDIQRILQVRPNVLLSLYLLNN